MGAIPAATHGQALVRQPDWQLQPGCRWLQAGPHAQNLWQKLYACKQVQSSRHGPTHVHGVYIGHPLLHVLGSILRLTATTWVEYQVSVWQQLKILRQHHYLPFDQRTVCPSLWKMLVVQTLHARVVVLTPGPS